MSLYGFEIRPKILSFIKVGNLISCPFRYSLNPALFERFSCTCHTVQTKIARLCSNCRPFSDKS